MKPARSNSLSDKDAARRLILRKSQTNKSPDATNKTDRFFRHPFVLLVAGFILTAVIGGALTARREAHDRAAEELSRRLAQATEQVVLLEKAYAEFQLRALLLHRGINASLPGDETQDRKRLYDESLVKLQVLWPRASDQINRAFPANNDDASKPKRTSVTYRMIMLSDLVDKLERCIENSYEHRRSTAGQDAPSEKCDIKENFPKLSTLEDALQESGSCSSMLFGSMLGALQDFEEAPLKRQAAVNDAFAAARPVSTCVSDLDAVWN
jgi:hypothetical protein